MTLRSIMNKWFTQGKQINGNILNTYFMRSKQMMIINVSRNYESHNKKNVNNWMLFSPM
jgi:hypothetical protein